jgi:N-acetylglutamate synthase-like GNAT family acetyltransferase
MMRVSLRMIRNAGITELYALCDLRFAQAPQFLQALGFEKLVEMGKPIDVLLYENLMTTSSDMPTKAWRLDMSKEGGIWR